MLASALLLLAVQSDGQHARPEKHPQAETMAARDDASSRRVLELRASGDARWVEFETTLVGDFSWHAVGGADEGGGASRALLDVFATVDAAVVGLSGDFLIDLQGIAGDDASADVGLVQPYSSIDAPDDRLQFARLRWESDGWGALSFVRIGKMDANDFFAVAEPALHFVHSSMGFSPTVLDLPTYPESAFGVSAAFEFDDAIDVKLGVFDGSSHTGRRTGLYGPSSVFGPPSDLFFIAESGWSWRRQDAGGRAAIGAWRHTGDFARYDGGVDEGADGYYATFEQRLAERADLPALEWFAQFGASDEQLSPFERHIGLGVVAVHPFCERVDDVLGLGVSRVELPDTAAAGFDRSHETAVELFYAATVAPSVRLQPTLHYIAAPGGRADLDDAWIATLRVVLTL